MYAPKTVDKDHLSLAFFSKAIRLFYPRYSLSADPPSSYSILPPPHDTLAAHPPPSTFAGYHRNAFPIFFGGTFDDHFFTNFNVKFMAHFVVAAHFGVLLPRIQQTYLFPENLMIQNSG